MHIFMHVIADEYAGEIELNRFINRVEFLKLK